MRRIQANHPAEAEQGWGRRGGCQEISAGAGIVADSVPANECEETLNKARGLLRALEMAEMQL